jgi:CheY-like chemotaxis protein
MMAEKYLPSAKILDIKLPGMIGIAVLDRIKDNPKIRHIPVRMMFGTRGNHLRFSKRCHRISYKSHFT